MGGKPSISPVVWDPPPIPERARAKQSTPPAPLPRLIPIGTIGPEDVAVDDQGWMFTGVDDGRILRVSPDGTAVDTVADVGGRPLGVELHPDGSLIVCNPSRALQRVYPDSGRVQTLATEVDGRPVRYCDNAHVAPDGRIYVSDSSQRFGHEHWRADIVEHSGTGRLLRWSPDGTVEVLLEGLQFANGVVVAPDQSFVVVAETGAYRITRLWLAGERAGRTEVFIDNLPGSPDNMSLGDDGLLWVALPSPRNPGRAPHVRHRGSTPKWEGLPGQPHRLDHRRSGTGRLTILRFLVDLGRRQALPGQRVEPALATHGVVGLKLGEAVGADVQRLDVL